MKTNKYNKYNKELMASISDIPYIKNMLDANNINYAVVPDGYNGRFRFADKDESKVLLLMNEYISKVYEEDVEQRRKYEEA